MPDDHNTGPDVAGPTDQPADDPRAPLGSMPDHKPGDPSAYAHGCRRHHACRYAHAQWKQKKRDERRAERINIPQVLPDGKTVENRWVHPALAPADTPGTPARHGTVYGRAEFACDCPPCRTARRIIPD